MPGKRTPSRPQEKALYPVVQEWLIHQHSCFETGINTGPQKGRMDVIGVRDVGRDLTGAFEVISVEVKRGGQPFAASAGQAYGYSVYAHKCYLADFRPSGTFTADELAIASQLRIGLLAITTPKKVVQVLSPPRHEPLPGFTLDAVYKLGYGECTICRSLFKFGEAKKNWTQVVARRQRSGALNRAAAARKGYVYWLPELVERDPGKRWTQRRLICPDCVEALFSEFASRR